MEKIGKFRVAATFAVLIFAGATLAQGPSVNIGDKHGNLRAAQQDIVNAYGKIDVAQKDNHDQLGGHADKAKQHLVEADEELRAAATYADQHGH
jgi:hypothetical protein